MSEPAPPYRPLTARQVKNRCKRIEAALDLLDTLWREGHPVSYQTAVGRTGYIGQARAALSDLESSAHSVES